MVYNYKTEQNVPKETLRYHYSFHISLLAEKELILSAVF